MILEIIIGILGFSVVVLGFTTFNLLNKNEKAEDIIVSYQEHISNLNEEIIKSEKRLNEIDQRGIFQSDDEIGWFFNEVKKIKRNLAKFKVDL
jgi:3-polyprenyl-4-hydroxybenzoate decarboxylase|tara:strand:- start:224 stop:502 length:279 start_codon:yes stop_codon:yes gene_type:complete